MKDKIPKGSKTGDHTLKRLFEEEARRRRLFEDAMGPQRVFEQATAATQMLKQVGGASRIAQEIALSRRMYDELGQHQIAMAESLRSLVDFPTLRLAQDVAAQWSQLNAPYREAAQSISALMAGISDDLRVSTAAMTAPTSLAVQAAHDSFAETSRKLIEATQPLRSLVDEIGRQYAEISRLVQGPQWEQLRTTVETIGRNYVLHAETGHYELAGTDVTMGVVRVLEGIGPDQASQASALATLLGLLLQLLRHIADATDKEIRSIGLVTAFMIIATIKTLEPQYTSEDRKIASETHQMMERAEADLHKIAEAEAKQHAYVEALPKAVVTGAGRVRKGPMGSAEMITKLPRETVVGVAGREGRWVRVVFRDELTHDLEEGWLYVGSLTNLTE